MLAVPLMILAAALPAAPATVKVADCSADESSAAFYARRRTVPAAARMWLRFTVEEKHGEAYDALRARGLSSWHKSKPGVAAFGYRQTIRGLQPGGVYRAKVSFRWYSADGELIERTRRTSRACRQFDEVPNLTSTVIGSGPAKTIREVSAREATKDAPIGGQAVLEGVMMRGVSVWAVAVRKPSQEQLAAGGANSKEGAKGEIEVISEPLVSWTKRHRLLRLPVVRGVVALAESLKIGFRALGISANAQMPAGEDGEKQEIGGGAWVGTIVFALLFAVALFFLLPAGLTNIFSDQIPNSIVFVVIEKLVRISIFLGYLWLISRMPDLQRVFQYHGAEHKTISCYEAGEPLTPENAQQYSRFHPRCGTSFLLLVMIVAIFVFAPLGKLEWHWLFVSRVLGIPIVAGPAVELIKWFGRNRTKRWARILMWPGIQLQRLTTREPDLSQLAVAIAALDAVLQVENPREAAAEDKVGMEVVA